MKSSRRLVQVLATLVILGGAGYLTSPSLAAAEPEHECKAGNGATCTGENCCANADWCYSNCPISDPS